MVKRMNSIPNPNKISENELRFLQNNSSSDFIPKNNHVNKVAETTTTDKCKQYMISMPESFAQELTKYLKANPTEGSRSGFMVRIVAEYLKSKVNIFR